MNTEFCFAPSECDACRKHFLKNKEPERVFMSCPELDVELLCYVCSDCVEEVSKPQSFWKIWAASSSMLRNNMIKAAIK